MAYENLPSPIESRDAEIIPFRRMSESDYERERARLREVYGADKREAGGRSEQELAKLFERSGWTQEQLAMKEGKGQTWVSYQLRFGRFLVFAEHITACDNLTEGRFRKAWSCTDKAADEPTRFREAAKILSAADLNHKTRNNELGRTIRQQCMDGKWRSAATIAEQVGSTEPEVTYTLEVMRRQGAGHIKYKIERKRVGREFQYRLFSKEKTVSSAELAEKLSPIIKELIVEGRKNAATAAPRAVFILAHRIQKLLDEWSE